MACDIIEKSIRTSRVPKTLHDMLRLYAKTARDFLAIHKKTSNDNKPLLDGDGDVELQDAVFGEVKPDLPIVCFEKASLYAERLLELSSDGISEDKSQESVWNNIVNVYIDKADCYYWYQSNVMAAFTSIQGAKKLVDKLPHEVQRIAMIEYNYAVDLNTKSHFEESITWLKDSFELYDLDEHKQVSKQARTLRLLSNSYIEMNDLESAKNCIKMANSTHLTPQGLFLEVKVFALLKRIDETEKALLELIRHPDTALNLSITACKITFENNM